MNSLREPQRSPNAPAVGSKLAKGRVYAVTTHSSCDTEPWNSCWIVGSARFSATPSTVTMNMPRQMAASPQAGFVEWLSVAAAEMT